MLVKFGTNAGGANWWSNFELLQVEPHENLPNLEPMQVAFYLAGEITQVLDAIPCVRCASGNVFHSFRRKRCPKLGRLKQKGALAGEQRQLE